MPYDELVVEVAGFRQMHQIPTTNPLIIKLWLQSNGGREQKALGSVHVICPGDSDIVLTARPSGRFGREPTED